MRSAETTENIISNLVVEDIADVRNDEGTCMQQHVKTYFIGLIQIKVDNSRFETETFIIG